MRREGNRLDGKRPVQKTTTPAQDEEAKIRLQSRQLLADAKAVMNTPAGRRLVWFLLDNGRVEGRTQASNAQETFYRNGRREETLVLYRIVRAADLNLYRLMEDEHRDEIETNGDEHG